ncbi:MAG TPA: hypothetical protein VG184_08910 [Acidimicrobiales bacterium]|jgi:hypothetical protein|nr:hypothetical protein [Acidimicrobiales bacterium]
MIDRAGPDGSMSCPSRACEPGVRILGVMRPSGHLAYLQMPAVVDQRFVARAKAEGSPERRFRFTGDCVENSCPQWTGERCAVADEVVSTVVVAIPTKLAACPIRRTCRWFAQSGAGACRACDQVVADVGGTATYRSRLAGPC